MGPTEVKKRYGIPPDLVPDFIALRGDPSDGIPGGTGIGEKTAKDLLLDHGTLEGAIANAIRERPRVQKALREEAELLLEYKEIATPRAGAGKASPPTGRPTFSAAPPPPVSEA